MRSVFWILLPSVLSGCLLVGPHDLVRIDAGTEPTRLEAQTARTNGKIKLERRTLRDWTSPADSVSWCVETAAAGTYEVSLTYSSPASSAGLTVEIACGDSRVRAKIHDTGGAERFLTVPVGLISLPAGESMVTASIAPASIAKGSAPSKPESSTEVFRLQGLVLEGGFVSLFNGVNLDGWDGNHSKGGGYTVEDGTIVCVKAGGGNLYSSEEYSDFAVRFEFRLDTCSNNGLGIRTPKGTLDAAYAGIEIQILDNECPKYKDKLEPWQYHGSVYGVIPASRGHLRPTGQWNVEEVVARGSHIAVKLNGVTIAEGDISKTKSHLKGHHGLHNSKGYLGFMGHGTEVGFRNLRIKKL